MVVLPNELTRKYPCAWEDEYRRSRKVQTWFDQYPDQFEGWMTVGQTPSTLSLFAQYCLMYLLRRDEGVSSITWCKVCSDPWRSKDHNHRDRTLNHWRIMRAWMGESTFTTLQTELLQAGFKDIKGELDLFCWNPTTKAWFFAEAKRKDKLTATEIDWIRVCRKALGPTADIRVYRLFPE